MKLVATQNVPEDEQPDAGEFELCIRIFQRKAYLAKTIDKGLFSTTLWKHGAIRALSKAYEQPILAFE